MIKLVGSTSYYTQYMLERLRYGSSNCPKNLTKQVADRLEKYELALKRIASSEDECNKECTGPWQDVAEEALKGSTPIVEQPNGNV